jgi:hypothetical protein
VPVTLRGPDGQTIDADEAKIQFWVNQGYHPISEDELGQELAARAEQPEDRGMLGGVNALVTKTLSGMTLGGSDVVLGGLMNSEQRARLNADIEQHQKAAIGGQIAGEVLPALVTGGESLAAEGLPASRLSRFATEVGEHVPGSGALSRVGRLAVTGAVEGSVSNAGQYLGQMALQDKPLSAEGFLASMRDGALYGGGTAGALGVAGEGLIAARRLLPEVELTTIAAKRAKATAVQEVSRAVDDSGDLVEAARLKARRIREETIAQQPELRQELDKIALQKARDLADAQVAAQRARQMKAEADMAASQSRAEAAAARAERAKNPGKRSKAPKETPSAGAPAETPVPEGLAGATSEALQGIPPSLQSAIPEVPQTPDDMIRKLMDTKNALDKGSSLSDLSARQKETLVEDALNARVAQINPEMDRLLRHLNGLDDARNQVAGWLDRYGAQSKVKSFEYAEGMRKPTGWVETVPAGEGSVGLPRGRQFELRGGDEARAGFENKVARGDLHRIVDDPLSTAEQKAAASRALEMTGDEQAKALADLQSARGLAGVDRLDPKATAKEIVGASEEHMAHGPSVDEHVDRSLNGHSDLHEDADHAIDAIGQLEQKTADLADELGDEAPVLSAERARSFRASQAGAEESSQKAAEAAVSDADKAAKTIGLGDAPARRASGILSKVEHAGQLLEALQMLGIPVPSAQNLPVVGPLLSMYLKAKLAMRAVSRLGGKVPRTAETEIARRASDVKTKLFRAADRALIGVGRAATSPRAAVASSVLAAQLFDDRDPGTKEKKTSPKDSMQDIYLARRDELVRAMAPGAVREAVRKRVRTADSALLDEIAAAEERKLKFVYSKMPGADDGPQVFGKRAVSAPARADMERWAKYVEAAQRPVETMEAILDDGLTSAEAAETLREVYPQLMQQVQQRLIEKALDSKVEMAYKRKVQLSVMLGLPLDDSQSPESAQFMGQMYSAKPQGAQGGMPPSGPNVQIASRVDPETRGSINAL